MTQHATACSCGQAGAVVTAAPRVRFRCHCTRCQSVYRAPYGDGLVFRRDQARPFARGRIDWIHTRRASPLSRGLCKACGEPVFARLHGLFCIVPTTTARSLGRPPVLCDIHYETRVADLDDTCPKYAGVLGGYRGLAIPLLRMLVAPGRPTAGTHSG